jgi:hypothetical protein
MRQIIIGVLLTLCVVPSILSAKDAVIFFGNGVGNDEEKAVLSMKKLKEVIQGDDLQFKGFNLDFDVAYNQSGCDPELNTENGCLDDIIESVMQKTSSINEKEFWAYLAGLRLATKEEEIKFGLFFEQEEFNLVMETANSTASMIRDFRIEDVAKHLVLYQNSISTGKKVVLVAHSQGNLFGNDVYPFLTPTEQASFGMVSVATPTDNVLGENDKSIARYTTLYEDPIHLVPESFLPNESNIIGGCDEDCSANLFDWSPHNFVNSYLASNTNSNLKIRLDIKSVLDRLTSPPQPPHPWPMLQHDAQHTGLTPIAGPSNPIIKWMSPLEGSSVFSSPIVGSDGSAYVGMRTGPGSTGKIRAVNADGYSKWSSELLGLSNQGGANNHTLSLDEKAIYVGTTHGVTTVDTTDGRTAFFYTPNAEKVIGNTGSTLAVDKNGRLYGISAFVTAFVGGEGCAFSLDIQGIERWNHCGQPIGGQTNATVSYNFPMVLDDVIYIGNVSNFGRHLLFSADQEQVDIAQIVGNIQQNQKLGISATEKGVLYWAISRGLQAWSETEGSYLWLKPLGACYNCDGQIPTINKNGDIIVSARNQAGEAFIRAFDATTNPDPLWEYPLLPNEIPLQSIVDTDGNVYVGVNSSGESSYGYILSLDVDGLKRWEHPVALQQPSGTVVVQSALAVSSDGTLYVAGKRDGTVKLFAFQDDTMNGQIEIKRIDRNAEPLTAGSAQTTARIDSEDANSNNPASYTDLSIRPHTIKVTDLPEFREKVAMCNDPGCTLLPSEVEYQSIPEGDCDGTFCTVSVNVLDGQLTRVVFLYDECADGYIEFDTLCFAPPVVN